MSLSLLTLLLSVSLGVEKDLASGLNKAPNWQLVQAHCGACHSLQLVTSQRGDRQFWRNTIIWMQQTQNLWPLAPADEEKILGYLSTQYGAKTWGRRPPLPVSLMPAKIVGPSER